MVTTSWLVTGRHKGRDIEAFLSRAVSYRSCVENKSQLRTKKKEFAFLGFNQVMNLFRSSIFRCGESNPGLVGPLNESDKS